MLPVYIRPRLDSDVCALGMSCLPFFHATLPRNRGHHKDTQSFETYSDNSDSQKGQLTAVVQETVPLILMIFVIRETRGIAYYEVYSFVDRIRITCNYEK
jgi:hypothetical protein